MFSKLNIRSTRSWANILLLVYITLLFFLTAFNKSYKSRPISVHQWRQSDCLSIAKNYYEEGMHFFEPKIHWQGDNGGKAVSECPILNYSVAGLWKLFGEHEYIYRFLEYFLFLGAILFLFNTIARFFRTNVLALFLVSLLLTSPLLVYYSFNFLADVPALSFCIVAFSSYYTFYRTKQMKYFYLSVVFGGIGVLMKASAIIGFATILFFSFADVFKLNGILRTEKVFSKKLFPIISLLLAIIVVALWYRFAITYQGSNNGVFLLTVLPIWEMDITEILKILRILFGELFPLFFNRPVFFLFLIMVLYVIGNFKKLDNFLRYSFVFSGVFFIAFLLFFFQVFTVHDYYLINLMIFPVITFFCTACIISQTQILINHKAFIRLTIVVMIFFNSFYSAATYRVKMVKDDKLAVWYPFLTRDEKLLWEYVHSSTQHHTRALYNIRPILRKAGIKRTDLVLSVPDPSFNITLYLMDQKGITMSAEQFGDPAWVNSLIDKFKFNYLVLCDLGLKRNQGFHSIEQKLTPLLTKDNVVIYKIKN
jgi:4-amino-4-deoxy-L-arabinose transferase-like glycosyltransferase